jgi:hypothetical protein
VRLVVASVVTVVALPLVLSQRDGNEQTAVAAVGPASALAEGRSATAPTAQEAAPSLAPSGFLTASPTSTAPGVTVIDIAVKGPASADQAAGKATFKRWAPGQVNVANPCATPLVEVGRVLTVTNLDNGQSTRCVNVSARDLPKGQVVVLGDAVFQLIGDLAQAPVPVQVSW